MDYLENKNLNFLKQKIIRAKKQLSRKKYVQLATRLIGKCENVKNIRWVDDMIEID